MIAPNHSINVLINVINVLLVVNEWTTGGR